MKKEAAIGLGLATIGSIWLISKAKAKPPPPGEGEATIKIEVYDSKGNLVPSNSPLSLDEGASYTVKLTITNKSTKGGVSWAALLTVGISAATTLTTLIEPQEADVSFNAGETKTLSYSLKVPMGSGGESGTIGAWVADPAGYAIANAQEYFAIVTIPIVYGATIVIG